MPFKANLGHQQWQERSWQDETHAPVILSFQFLPDEGTYLAGTVLAREPVSRKLGRYDPDHADTWRHEIFGIVTIQTHTDNDQETIGNVMIHGAVQKEKLILGVDPKQEFTEQLVDRLRKIHIYAI